MVTFGQVIDVMIVAALAQVAQVRCEACGLEDSEHNKQRQVSGDEPALTFERREGGRV